MLAAASFSAYLSGITKEERLKARKEMLATDQGKIRSLAPYIKGILDEYIIAAVGGEEKINTAEGCFGEITKMTD